MISGQRFEGQMFHPVKWGKRYPVIGWSNVLLDLTKFKISLFAALSTLTGFILSYQGLSGEVILPVIGIFFLACGSCALNQYQERREDSLMERTKHRPIPSGKIRSDTALKISLFFILMGSLFLFCGDNLMVVGLGLFAILWYNGVYTCLKRHSAFAAIPGALIGSIPPVVGWVSGGGHPLDPQILAIAFFFFIWQVPHFWLLLLSFGKDYEKAGFPSLTRIFTPAQLSRMTFMWILATAVACLILPLFGIGKSHAIHGGLFVAALWLVWKGSRLLTAYKRDFPFRSAFDAINSYVALVMVLVALGSFLN